MDEFGIEAVADDFALESVTDVALADTSTLEGIAMDETDVAVDAGVDDSAMTADASLSVDSSPVLQDVGHTVDAAQSDLNNIQSTVNQQFGKVSSLLGGFLPKSGATTGAVAKSPTTAPGAGAGGAAAVPAYKNPGVMVGAVVLAAVVVLVVMRK